MFGIWFAVRLYVLRPNDGADIFNVSGSRAVGV